MKRKYPTKSKKDQEEIWQEPEEDDTCEYCGRKIEDRNDTGSLCYRCYMKEYYPGHEEY